MTMIPPCPQCRDAAHVRAVICLTLCECANLCLQWASHSTGCDGGDEQTNGGGFM